VKEPFIELAFRILFKLLPGGINELFKDDEYDVDEGDDGQGDVESMLKDIY